MFFLDFSVLSPLDWLCCITLGEAGPVFGYGVEAYGYVFEVTC